MTAPANKQLNARGGVRCPQQRRLGPPRVFTDYARRRRAKPTPRSLSVIHTQTRMRLATQSAGATAPTRSEHPHPPPRAAWSGAQQGGFGGAPTVRADERRPWWAIQRWAAGVRKVTPAYTHGCYSPPQKHPHSAHTNTARHSKHAEPSPAEGEGDTGAPHLYRPQAAL